MSNVFLRPVSGFLVLSACLSSLLGLTTALSGTAVASSSNSAASVAAHGASLTNASSNFIEAKMNFGRTSVSVSWYLPETQHAKGFVILFHGFARNKGHMRDLASRLQKEGLVVLTPSLGLGLINNKDFLNSMSEGLSALEKIPGTEFSLPSTLVVAGHSAGGKNAAILGASLRRSLGERLAGVMLLDPVERDGQLETALNALEEQGVDTLSVLARPSSCNANSNATELLKRFKADFKGLRFVKGSHCDAEGTSTDGMCRMPCGASQEQTMESTQAFAVNWILGFSEASRRHSYFPGGEVLGKVLDNAEGSLLE